MRQGSGHNRSISHPFPSIFGTGKRVDRAFLHPGGADALESTDDEAILDGEDDLLSLSPSGKDKGKPRKDLDKDLTAGRCMTCDSLVRWPKDLKVFRCTICLTINDLKPAGQEGRSNWGLPKASAGPRPADASPRDGMQRELQSPLVESC